jgi:2-dehydro-3-deoxyphosphooctonate aldolase (KDO 8-P synthase)
MNPSAVKIPLLRTWEQESFLLIAGPCAIENEELVMRTAEVLCGLTQNLNIPFIFKSSYRKANRSGTGSFTGIGDQRALEILAGVRNTFKIPVTTDIHSAAEANMAAAYVDVIQIPAFLCRQTDILTAAALTGRWVNIKKGQFMSGDSMGLAVQKIYETGNRNVILTERGNLFGYNDLVMDMRNIPLMKKAGVPVLADITHALQSPNLYKGLMGANTAMAETLGLASLAAGADGIFMETHPLPENALCDGSNMVPLAEMEKLLNKFAVLRKTVSSFNI